MFDCPVGDSTREGSPCRHSKAQTDPFGPVRLRWISRSTSSGSRSEKRERARLSRSMAFVKSGFAENGELIAFAVRRASESFKGVVLEANPDVTGPEFGGW